MEFQVPAIYADAEKLKGFLGEKPEAQIIQLLSHDEKKGYYRVQVEGVPYEDEFGLPVYLGQSVDWEGELTDLDERYAGTGMSSSDFVNL